MSTDFEKHVWAQLVLAVLNVDGKATIQYSILYSYAIIKNAALHSQLFFPSNHKIQDLQFTDKWIRGFLDREKMRRRKITSVKKEIPSPINVRAQMGIGQALILFLGLLAWQIWNFDETAFTWAIGPTHAFVPEGQRRAHKGSRRNDGRRRALSNPA